jgi:hypothetical protein
MVQWPGRRRRPDDRSAAELMEEGAGHLSTDLGAAERCYRRSLEIDPELAAAWFDLGLIYKWRREWTDSLACNQRVIELAGGEPGAPAYWNAGIAATALRDFDVARWAWRGFGVPISDGDGPIEEDLGHGAVRLPVGEVVWGRRIDPARMRLLSIPLPESGFRSEDIVLHDGEPKGSRVSNGREYSVFNVIDRWEASPIPTVEVIVRSDDVAVAKLLALLLDRDVPAENWTRSIDIRCRACSEGRVDYDNEDHNHEQPSPGDESRIGCSGQLDEVRAVAAEWAETPDCELRSVEVVA